MSSPVNQVLADYVAGRTTAGELVRAVRAAHYGPAERSEPAWRALVETIERAAPGSLELTGSRDAPGFALKPLDGSVAASHELALREAASAALAAWGAPGPEAPPAVVPVSVQPSANEGLWARLVRRLRSLFGRGAG